MGFFVVSIVWFLTRPKNHKRPQLPAPESEPKGWRPPLLLRAAEVLADDAATDFLGAGADLQELGVAPELLHMVLPAVAVAPEDLDRSVRHVLTHLPTEELHAVRVEAADAGAVAIGRALEKNATLETINLSRAQIGDAGGQTPPCPERPNKARSRQEHQAIRLWFYGLVQWPCPQVRGQAPRQMHVVRSSDLSGAASQNSSR